MKVDCECMYCGNKWTIAVWDMDSLEHLCCPQCKDEFIKTKEKVKENKDYY